MAEKILLVQGDTRPQLMFSLTDKKTGAPVVITGATLRMLFREVGSTTVKEAIPAYPIPGIVLEDGTVSFAGPYNVSGSGGRAALDWSTTALDKAGDFEGELEVTFSDGTIQTSFEILRFRVREQF